MKMNPHPERKRDRGTHIPTSEAYASTGCPSCDIGHVIDYLRTPGTFSVPAQTVVFQ